VAILNEPVLGTGMAAAMTAHNLPPIGGSAFVMEIVST